MPVEAIHEGCDIREFFALERDPAQVVSLDEAVVLVLLHAGDFHDLHAHFSHGGIHKNSGK